MKQSLNTLKIVKMYIPGLKISACKMKKCYILLLQFIIIIKYMYCVHSYVINIYASISLL